MDYNNFEGPEKERDFSSEEKERDYEVLDEMPTPGEGGFYSPSEKHFADEPKIRKPKRSVGIGKVWLISACSAVGACIITAIAVVLIMSYISNNAALTRSTIIYRDGNDLRTKVDLSTALSLDTAEDGTPLSVPNIANRVAPSVVGIAIEGTATGNTIFGPTTQQFQSSGTGIIISTDGYIVTNNHVIAGANRIIVTLDNDKEYVATLVGADEKTDLAVIKISERNLKPAVLGNSSDVQVGEAVIAIGNPLGQELSGTVTAGIISATNRKVTVDGIEFTLLQTDAAINSGNSGGALVNAYGEIIGINNAKIAASGVEGLGFAIPSDLAKPVIADLIEVGYVRGRPLIGINGRNITEEMSASYDLPIGVYVVSVANNSAADAADLKPGDVITHCNGKRISTVEELNEIRDTHRAGDTLILKVTRDGTELEIDVILGEDKPSASLN